MLSKTIRIFAVAMCFAAGAAATDAAAAARATLINFKSGSSADVDGWFNFTQEAGGNLPSGGAMATNGVSFFATSDSGNFKGSFSSRVTSEFSEGAFTNIYGAAEATLADEIRASLALPALVFNGDVYQAGVAHGFLADRTATIGGLNPNQKYVVYLGFGDAQNRVGFAIDEDGCDGGALEYAATLADEASGVVATNCWTRFDFGETKCAGANGALVVRLSGAKPRSDGTIAFTLAGARSAINFVAVRPLGFEIVRVHPWLTRGAGEEAILGVRGMVAAGGKQKINMKVRLKFTNCVATDFYCFRLYTQPNSASVGAGERSTTSDYTVAVLHHGAPNQTNSNSLWYHSPKTDADEYELNLTNNGNAGDMISIGAGDSLWLVAHPKETISPDAARVARALCVFGALILGAAANLPPAWWIAAFALTVAVVVYNRTKWAVVMGLCRALNVVCGAAVALGAAPDAARLQAAALPLGIVALVWLVYIAAVTKMSEGEEFDASKKAAVGMLIGSLVYIQLFALVVFYLLNTATRPLLLTGAAMLILLRLAKHALPKVSAS